ncbi:MAG TPA: LysM peptidoglycan-binding domain-containing protein [Mollicutes bacterium]|nr:LysM peptidoglycan-binding domain-containing protein [Mollicutes bacterium]
MENNFETLKEGSSGDNVIILQDKLKLMNVFFGSITGSFGPTTTEAVKEFQRRQNLPVTGEVDERTWNILNDLTSDTFADEFLSVPVQTGGTPSEEMTSVLSRPTVREGDTGPVVRELQTILSELSYLSGAIDGIFGPATGVAVRTFQTNNRLTPDGIVGRNTWSALVYLYSPLAICGPVEEPPGEGDGYQGVVVDPGHGGSDPGAVGSAFLEKDKNLQISRYMANRFEELGVPYFMTRDTDETISNQERVNRMKRPFGDVKNAIVVSNHINAGGGEGAEVIYPLRDEPDLAQTILNELGNAGQVKRRVYQRTLPNDPSRDYYYIMRDTNNLPVVIVEYGFLDNPKDSLKLQQNWENYAEAAVKAITDFMGIPYEVDTTGNVYAVVAGDTLYGIARRFNTTVNAIRDLNNLTTDSLSIGQLLVIPNGSPTLPPPSAEFDTYVVRPNDTLYSIARNYNVTVDQIKALNNLTNNLLSIGQTLKIPSTGGSSEPALEEYYTVTSGDTLYSIARRFNTTVDNIKRLNNLTSDVLSIGQTLVIPGSGVVPPTVDTMYTVKSGDTLWGIGNQFNVTVDSIKTANNLTNNILSIGQVLTIPQSRNEDYEEYKVKSGESLWTVANKFNMTVDKLKDLNNLTSNQVSVNQKLKIKATK